MKVAFLTTDARECYLERWKDQPYFGSPQEALFHAIPQFPEVEFHVLSCWQKPMNAPLKLASNIWFHGLHTPKLGWLRTGYQGCIRAVRRKLREINPNIVHGQGTERDCAISAVFSGYPNVITIHGNMAELARLAKARFGTFAWCAARLENFTLRRTEGVFCNSAYTESLVKPRTQRTWRVPNPIRELFFEKPAGPALASRCRLLNIGVISPRKRQVELLQVAQALHKQGVDAEWQFIGLADSSAYTREFLARIVPAEQAGYARYLGIKSLPELVECFDQASALVHFPTEEAFGLVVAEGLARNIKFFGARVGGIVEIAEGTPGAELFEVNDSRGLADAIGSWIRNGFPKPSNAASESIRRRYQPVVIARQHFAIYREVLSNRS